MNKVVINKCYGGFSLSRMAAERLLETGFEDEDLKRQLLGNIRDIDSYRPHIPRHHPLLVQVVEELGENASGSYANLQVVSIDEDFYQIDEYDGWETIETPNSQIWINCKNL